MSSAASGSSCTKARDLNDPLFALGQARALDHATETIFLGLADGAPRFAFGIAPEAAEALKSRDGLDIRDLRSIAVQGLVAPEHLGPLAEAKAVLHWHQRHRFCSNCGAATQVSCGGWRRDCPQCQAQHFPRTDPVVIMLAVDGERCLLGRSPRFMTNMWSCLAGFMEPGESFEDAVRRETLRGSRHRLRARALFRLAALAVSELADDRLRCRGGHARSGGRPLRA